ncbi:MAG: haloacid dehalogenase-like hydrolase, partial [Thermodesulfobacteriota bacterium]
MLQVQLNTACQGPLATNDNVIELCREFLSPQGDFFFKQVRRYDNYLATIAKRPGFQAGDSTKLILPFLKAAGLTNERVAEYSRQHLALTPKAEEACRFLLSQDFPLFVLSAGYRQFAAAVAERLGLAPERLFCTELDLDRYELPENDAKELAQLLEQIAAAPALDLPPNAKTLEDLAPEVQETIHLLDTIFWDTIPRMDIGRIYQETTTLGGPEKAKALEDSLAQTGLDITNAMYVGDNITDVPTLQKVRAGGGVALAFNGSRDAIAAAEIIVVADTAWPVALLGAVFRHWGKEGVVELAQSSRPGASRYLVLPEAMIEPIARGLQGSTFNLYHPETSTREDVLRDSEAMRRRLR